MTDSPVPDSPMHAHNRQAHRDMSRKEAALPQKERQHQAPPDFNSCDPFLQIVAKGHFEHDYWQQIGPCVYCSCGFRMFQGSLKTILEKASEIEVIE